MPTAFVSTDLSDAPDFATLGRTYAPPAALLRNRRDARVYSRATLAYVLALYVLLGLALANQISAWVLVAGVPLIYLRLALALHELLHSAPAAEVSWFHRLTMIFESPVCLGYREHRAIHFAHHRHASTDRDPERYQIVGNGWRAFGAALISPEHAVVTWVRTWGVTRTLATEATIRCAAFIALVLVNRRVFLIYWITLRVSIGFASFVFHHVLHSLEGRLGTFPLPVSATVVRAARIFFGREPMLILTEHARHHEWPRVRARDLPLLPEVRA